MLLFLSASTEVPSASTEVPSEQKDGSNIGEFLYFINILISRSGVGLVIELLISHKERSKVVNR